MAKEVKEKKEKKKKKAQKKTDSKKKKIELDIAAGYNRFKEYKGQQYTGMKIGRSHKWYYDQGVWRERKMAPDEWQIDYQVKKRRAGKAPEGSGVPVGTKYHWFILAHQMVEKLDANTYSTAMEGTKHKIGHMRAGKDDWNISEKAQKKRLIKVLHRMAGQLEKELEEEKAARKKKK